MKLTIILLIIYLLIGVGISFILTKTAGESFTFDSHTIKFILTWPYLFFRMFIN